MNRLGIISAMEEETLNLEHQLKNPEVVFRGPWTFHRGLLTDFPVVLGRSGWGKVAAAAHTQFMIDYFEIDKILFIGVAGGLSPYIHRGDIVVATEVVQHDFDARPFFSQGEIPILRLCKIKSTQRLCETAYRACTTLVQQFKLYLNPTELTELGVQELAVHKGLVLTGDQIIFDPTKKTELLTLFPEALSVDMESAAIAQVCHTLGVQFAVIRIISDTADKHGEYKFSDFINRFVNRFTKPIVQNFTEELT